MIQMEHKQHPVCVDYNLIKYSVKCWWILSSSEFSAMDYTLNIESKIRFFKYLKFAGSEKPLENLSWGPWKSWSFCN